MEICFTCVSKGRRVESFPWVLGLYGQHQYFRFLSCLAVSGNHWAREYREKLGQYSRSLSLMQTFSWKSTYLGVGRNSLNRFICPLWAVSWRALELEWACERNENVRENMWDILTFGTIYIIYIYIISRTLVSINAGIRENMRPFA